MIRDIRRQYFEIWGSEEAQNSFLKGVLIILGILSAIQSIVLCYLALRKPVLVAVGQTETQVFTMTPPTEDLLNNELKRVVRKYVESHYTWDNSTVEKAHAEASRYVSTQFVKAFKAANIEQIKLAKEKKLSQKVYVSELSVNSKDLTAHLILDRILMVEGLRAASQLTFDISFEYGPRTSSNPEGIYIVSEKVVNS
jgi:hypothetical protein